MAEILIRSASSGVTRRQGLLPARFCTTNLNSRHCGLAGNPNAQLGDAKPLRHKAAKTHQLTTTFTTCWMRYDSGDALENQNQVVVSDERARSGLNPAVDGHGAEPSVRNGSIPLRAVPVPNQFSTSSEERSEPQPSSRGNAPCSSRRRPEFFGDTIGPARYTPDDMRLLNSEPQHV
jgi:hypothetical protein